ncbi:hypothetical protein Mtc_1644 [Methanocella conradii HZ254]|uniref:Peptidase MA-like domain-containing protein n=1 Tax=Methanocella conradii (strain DSM 24694 / JCM 17849 / CGMCC 1.5162 / HZ254) TaxID=1041930 RepID=H8I7Z3_METCZ|nr:hypothetical protein [Methanocella conradii]AFD00393.1 hypothetical protein Mtc_1644 [Methanocella conradii HZ254]
MVRVHYAKGLLELFEKAPALQNRIEYTLWFFPEIEDIRFGRAARSAYYDSGSGTVRLTRGSSVYVIGHEITHYLQDGRHFNGKTLPEGERQCDLFLFARSPALVFDVWEGRDSSYLGKALNLGLLKELYSKEEGQMMVYEACREAVAMYKERPCHYIRWAEKRINENIMQRLRHRYS